MRLMCKLKILKGSLDSVPSPSVKIQTIGGKVCLRCKGKILLGVVNKLLRTKCLLTTPSNVWPLHLNQTFPPVFWIFIEGKGDGIEYRLPFKHESVRAWHSIIKSRPLLLLDSVNFISKRIQFWLFWVKNQHIFTFSI